MKKSTCGKISDIAFILSFIIIIFGIIKWDGVWFGVGMIIFISIYIITDIIEFYQEQLFNNGDKFDSKVGQDSESERSQE